MNISKSAEIIISMNSFKYQSSQLLVDLREDNKKQVNILRAIQEYEQTGESDDQQDEKAIIQDDMYYQGFENKKSLQIKPLNMFKDLITLRKQNVEKRQEVKNLEKLNEQLRAQYESALTHNKKLESFLREVEFTFQQDHKKAKTSDVMLRARRTLFQEARQAKDRLKRMFRNSEASTVQQLKVYISTLESEKERLKNLTVVQRNHVMKRMQEEDFNAGQIQNLQTAFERVKKSLQRIFERVNEGRQQYKIEKMQMRHTIKIRELQSRKISLKQQSEAVRQLSVENEGLEYQIQLLRHRLKDRKKQFSEYEQLKEHIQTKHSTIIRLQKELREKNKTFDYMLEWTKELKKQLQERKLDHARKKAEYEQQINSLSQKYERYNQIYKTGLFEEQVARRKGPRDPQPQNLVKTNTVGRQVTILQIKFAIKSLAFQLFKNQVSNDKFIQNILKVNTHEPQRQVGGRRIKLKTSLSIQPFMKEMITVSQLADNLRASPYDISPEMIIKIARFVVEDGSGKADDQACISILVAKQVLKKLLERSMDTEADLLEAENEFSVLMGSQMQSIRHQLKILGGKQEEISIDVLRQIFILYGTSPYYANLLSEFLEFYGWSKRKETGFILLQDFDEIFSKLKNGEDLCLQDFIS